MYLYAYIHSNGTLGEIGPARYPMSGENWVSVYYDEAGQPAQVSLEVEIPDEFLAKWQQYALANIEKEEARIRAEAQRQLRDVWELKEKLLSLPAPELR